MSTALSALCMDLARMMGESIKGTPSGTYTTTGFDCAGLAAYADDYFNDWNGRFYVDTNKDKSFVVTDFVTSTGHITFTPAATLVDAADLFYLCPDFTPQELIDAINMAISMVEQEALEDKTDATLATIASTFEYAVPSGFAYIQDIFQESNTADKYSPSSGRIPRDHWRVLHGATPKVWFDDPLWSYTASRNLRVVGQQYPSLLTLDADTSNVNRAFLLQQAKAVLHQSRIRGRGADFEEHETQMRLAQAMASEIRTSIRVAPRGLKVTN